MNLRTHRRRLMRSRRLRGSFVWGIRIVADDPADQATADTLRDLIVHGIGFINGAGKRVAPRDLFA